jgi:hypothetical protein
MRVWFGLAVAAMLTVAADTASGEILNVEPNGTGSLMLEEGRGVIIHDLSGAGGSLNVDWLIAGPPDKKKKQGFEMLDSTLRLEVVSGLSDYRACVMRKGRKREIDALRINRSTAVLMKRRLVGSEMVFRPLTDLRAAPGREWTLYRETAAPTREKVRLGADRGRLGSYGYLTSGGNVVVWGTWDILSDWGIGGMVPEPTTAVLVCCGGAGLLLLRRTRRT